MEKLNSSESSMSSITEYVNAMREDSELESSINSVNVHWDTQNDKDDIKIIPVESGQTMDTFGEVRSLETFEPSKKGFRKMYLAALAALVNAICMGYGGAYTATATENMKREDSPIKPNDDQVGWIASLLTIGALVGGLVAGYLTQSFGRKGALILNIMPFAAGWFFIAYAHTVLYLYIGRFIVGFCCGVVSVTTPMYLIEISTPEVRGLLGASFQLFVTIGILIVALMGAVLKWEWLAITGGCILVVTLIVMIPIPESPRWLMATGRKKEAARAIRWLQGNFIDATEECKAIQDDIDNQPKGKLSITEFLVPEAYKPALLSVGLMLFQQFAGINVVMFYTVAIFKKAGSTLSSTLANIIIATVQVIATSVGSILMDKAGRKILLLISGSCMALSLIIFAGFDFVAIHNPGREDEIRKTYGWLPVVCLMMYITAFSLGLGPIPWLMVGEMTMARLRSVTTGAATALNWTFAFIVTKSFHDMTLAIHDYGTYFTYAGICLVSCIFTFCLLPETKGKQMEEIRDHFTSKKNEKNDTDSNKSNVQEQSLETI